MLETLFLFNSFINIMLGRRKHDFFPNPNDIKLDELFKLVSIVSEWKNESGSN